MRVLYGLKQSSRAQYTKLNNYLLAWGFKSSQLYSSMMILYDGKYVTIIYVDDIVFRVNDPKFIQ